MAAQDIDFVERLPHALALRIFTATPPESRLLCREVSRGWLKALQGCDAWLQLDMEYDIICEPTDKLLRALAARALGRLKSLNVSGCSSITQAVLLAVVAASGVLEELYVCGGSDGEIGALDGVSALALADAAPQLRRFDAQVRCGPHAAVRLLRNPAVRLEHLCLESQEEGDVWSDGVLLALSDALACTAFAPWFMSLQGAPLGTAEAMGALVDGVLKMSVNAWSELDVVVDPKQKLVYKVHALKEPLPYVELEDCSLSPASAPALARLLGGALETLSIQHVGQPLLDAPAARVLGDALRASTLTQLMFYRVDFGDDAADMATLLRGLEAHPSLRHLMLNWCGFQGIDNETTYPAAIGAALGALIAANAPALTELAVPWNNLGDAGMDPLVDALPRNTHLVQLDWDGNDISEAFKRDRLLPAMRAHPRLRCSE
jgi:hypothetical protein